MIDVWENSSWSERSILAPIVNVKYDRNNVPILVCPYFEPICSNEEAECLEEDEAIAILQEKMFMFNQTEEQIVKFFESIDKFCAKHEIDISNVLRKLNNIGYNPNFGFRIINYGIKERNKSDV